MPEPGCGADAEGFDQPPFPQRIGRQRLPGEHDAAAGNRRIEAERGLVEDMADIDRPRFDTRRLQPDIPGKHRLTIDDGRQVKDIGRRFEASRQ